MGNAMENLEEAKRNKEQKEQELGQSIKVLVKELYRLRGMVCYEELDEDLEVATNLARPIEQLEPVDFSKN